MKKIAPLRVFPRNNNNSNSTIRYDDGIRYDDTNLDFKKLETIIRDSLNFESADSDSKPSAVGYKKRELRNNTWSFLNYLQNEKMRIEKLANFFLFQLNNRIQYSQTETLIAQTQQQKNRIIHELLMRMQQPNSSYQHNMSKIFNRSFFRK